MVRAFWREARSLSRSSSLWAQMRTDLLPKEGCAMRIALCRVFEGPPRTASRSTPSSGMQPLGWTSNSFMTVLRSG